MGVWCSGPTLVHGGPDWLGTEPYDFEAKAASPDADEDQIWGMVRTLLEDRFKLKVHRETHEAQVYTLVVGKAGPKCRRQKGKKTISIGQDRVRWSSRKQTRRD